MGITADQKYLLNKMNSIAKKVALGDLIEAAEGVSSQALANGKILVGDGDGKAAAVTPSGDVTITNAGVTAIGANKVTKAMLAAIVTPSHVVKFAGKHTTVGGAASEDITVTGALGTDIVLVSLQAKGATPRTILTALPAADKITLEFSGDPAADHVVSYIVLRATS